MNLSRHTYETRNNKVVDFVIGFIGWWLVNGILYGITQVALPLATAALGGLGANNNLDTLFTIVGLAAICLPLLLNLGIVIFFAFTRYWIALGALAAFGAALLVALCIGLVAGAACFAILAGYTAFGP